MSSDAKVHRKEPPSGNPVNNSSAVWALVVLITFAIILYFRHDLAKPLYRLVSFLVHPDMARGVFWGSLLVTFVASVMGKDQQQRLDQGKFGLAAGTTLGGLSGLIKNQPDLVVVGFVGSALGGLLGWSFYLFLAFMVMRFQRLESLVRFQTGGLEDLQKHLDIQSKTNLREGFKAWTEKFSRMMADQNSVLAMPAGDSRWEDGAVIVMRGWVTAAVDTLALVFGTLADKPLCESRVTIIVYRDSEADGKPQAKGRHWISYSGRLKPHLKDHLFDETSIGYKVLKQQLESPHFTTKDIAQKDGQPRADDPSYRPFITFRLNDSAILALDWPEELEESDDYVREAQSLFYSDVTPAISEVLSRWPRSIADSADVPGLRPGGLKISTAVEAGPKARPVEAATAAPAKPPATASVSASKRLTEGAKSDTPALLPLESPRADGTLIHAKPPVAELTSTGAPPKAKSPDDKPAP
jgi:hypothetical protein